MQNLRKQFPVLNRCIYANTAAAGLLGEDLLEWRQENDLDFLIGGGSAMNELTYELVLETRTTIAAFFGGSEDNVALVPNFSIGLNFLLEGLDKQEKVLLLTNDYPSLKWPFENRGFDISYVETGEYLEEEIYDIVKSKAISVLALSLVQWLDGVKIDLDFLKKLKDEFPNLMIIADGTQFCGMMQYDFSNSAIDVLGASGYKWLLAGYGNGFLMVKEVVKTRFSLGVKGNGSGRNAVVQGEVLSFCKHLEPGHFSALNIGSLNFSLQFLKKIGMEKIERQNQKLSVTAMKGFAALGLLEDWIPRRKEHSTIFNISGDQKVFGKLRANNVVCVQRGAGIRFGFHFYNTLDEVTNIMEILKKQR